MMSSRPCHPQYWTFILLKSLTPGSFEVCTSKKRLFFSPTDTFFHKRHIQGKLPESVMSWSPCRVRLGWRYSSEDRYTQILLQVWKSLHKVCGTLLHPPSLVLLPWKTGSITVWQGDSGQGKFQ
jgi:hypothetical protein